MSKDFPLNLDWPLSASAILHRHYCSYTFFAQNLKDPAGHYASRFSRNDSLARVGIFHMFKSSNDYIVCICDRSYAIALLVLISVNVIHGCDNEH